MNKLGKLELNWFTGILGVLALYVLVAPFRAWVDDTIGGIGAGAEEEEEGEICIYDGTVMTIGPIKKRYDPGTEITNAGTRVFVNGVDRGVRTDSATMDVTVGDEIGVYYIHNSTVGDADTIGYYIAEQKFTVPCAATISTADADLDPENKHKVIAMDTPTITVFNDDDDRLNKAGQLENLSSSDSTNLEVKVKKSSEKGFAPYGMQAICVQYNSTSVEEIKLSAVSGVSGSVSEIDAVPEFLEDEDHLGTTATFDVKCWESQGTHSDTTVTEIYDLYIKTDSDGMKAGRSEWNLSMVDQDFFQNTDTSEMEMGYEDNDESDVGLRTPIANTTIFFS